MHTYQVSTPSNNIATGSNIVYSEEFRVTVGLGGGGGSVVCFCS